MTPPRLRDVTHCPVRAATPPSPVRVAAVAEPFATVFAVVLVAVVAAGCAERARPLVTPAAPPEFLAVPIACRVDAEGLTGRCSAGAAARGPDAAGVRMEASGRAERLLLPDPGGFTADAVLGAQAAALSVTGVAREPGSGPTATYSLQVTLSNLLDQAMGLGVPGQASETPDTAGVRVFVEKGPDGEGTQGATAELLGADVTGATGSGPGQSAMQYASPIVPGGSAVREWRVRIGGGATGFSFRAVVVARLADESSDALSAVSVGVADVRPYDVNACALTTTGRVYCWGDGAGFGLGAGTTGLGAGILATPTEVPIAGNTFVIGRASGSGPTLCAVRPDGALACRGAAPFLETLPDSATYVEVPPAPLASVVMADAAICGLDASGVAWCRGRSDGPVGSTSGSTSVFTRVDGTTRFSRLVAGERFVCGLSTSGRPWCWGDNSWGQLGRVLPGGATWRSFPVAVSDSAPSMTYTAIAASADAACALDAGGTPWCWGAPGNGQLGRGDSVPPLPRPRPGRVLGLGGGTQLTSLTAGHVAFCGLTAPGKLYCWGGAVPDANDNSPEDRWTAEAVKPALSFREVAMPSGSLCGIQRGGGDDGRVVCWGYARGGILGQPANVAVADPEYVQTARPVAGLAPAQVDRIGSARFPFDGPGSSTVCAWSTTSRRAWCWGLNEVPGPFGPPLAEAARVRQLRPLGLPTGRRFSQMATGGETACAIEIGTQALFCWGTVPDGQGTYSDVPVRIPLPGDRRALQVAIGASHGCVLATNDGGVSDRRLYCSGDNGFGQLGDGTQIDRRAASAVAGDRNWRSVALGARHSCAIEASDNKVWCWGDWTFGQLGRPDFSIATSPKNTSPTVFADTLAAGDWHTCARQGTATAAIKCWGDNTYGQLGRVIPANSDYRAALVNGITTSTFLTAGRRSTCSIGTDGIVSCWGEVLDAFGYSSSRAAPTVVDGDLLGGRVGVAGMYCGIRADGRARCLGSNPGNGLASSSSLVPLRLPVAGSP